MPRFVLLFHELPATNPRKSHWDLLLEPELATAEASAAGLLRTWALETPLDGPQPLKAERLADHRRLYLDYEGPISGDRGDVCRVAAGKYRLLEDSAAQTIVILESARFRGRLVIEHLGPEAARMNWTAD